MSGMLLSLAGGCARPPKYARPTVPATVEVKLDGRPASGVYVCLSPGENGYASYGKTRTDGKVRLTTFQEGDGAVLGSYRVILSLQEVIVNPAAHLPDPKDKEAYGAAVQEAFRKNVPVSLFRELMPQRYSDAKTSDLTAEVKPDGGNAFVFEVDSEPWFPPNRP